MKILLITDPGLPVPPKLYGGIERIVYQLANEYAKLGHEVTLLAGPDSFCSGKAIPFGKNDLKKSKWQLFKEMLYVWIFLIKNHKKYDLVHNFGRLAYLLPVLNRSLKKIMSYQREVTAINIKRIHTLPYKNLYFTGCSDYISKKQGLTGNWHTVYNFVDITKYALTEKIADDAPFIFLGRIERIKGCHHCIKLALNTGKKLIIAGNISELPHEKSYFQNEISPFIDGKQIRYVGPVNDEQKNHYLGQSAALLMLIDWDEPFGIVMAEALACGTPVIGFPRGAVKEVIKDNIAGFLINDMNTAINALNNISLINREACREIVKIRFDIEVIAKQYLDIF